MHSAECCLRTGNVRHTSFLGSVPVFFSHLFREDPDRLQDGNGESQVARLPSRFVLQTDALFLEVLFFYFVMVMVVVVVIGKQIKEGK